MMQSSNAIVLRVFSGPHLGAELQLPLGDHVIGCEDSCDLIFVDASLLGRHAVIQVAGQKGSGKNAPPETLSLHANDTNPSNPNSQDASLNNGQQTPKDEQDSITFTVRPLDGDVLVNGEPVGPQGQAVAACTLFEVGTTSLAWNTVGASWSVMSMASLLGHGLSEAASQTEPIGEPMGGDAGLSFYDDLEVGLQADATEQAQEHVNKEALSLRGQAQKVVSLPLKTLIAIFLAIICLCGVLVSFEGRPPDMTAHASELEEKLHSLGMTGLSVSFVDDSVLIQGILDSHAQRTELWHLTSDLLYPVEITATVREDLLLAVAAAFNSRHMYPEVLSLHEAEKNTSAESDARLQISGYFQDGQVEAWAFQSMHADVPTSFDVERNVRHQDDVKAVLAPALIDAKLDHVRTRFMPGVVQVAGHFDLEQHTALDNVLMSVQDTLGVPIRFEVYAELPKSLKVAAATKTSDPRALEDAHKEAQKEAALAEEEDEVLKPLGDLSVVSVTLNPLCFFTTDDGQRFFEGAVLPSGYSVEKITMDALTLKKDGAEIVHNL